MTARRGAFVACLLTILPVPRAIAQGLPDGSVARSGPPAPCVGDSVETHARRGNMIAVPSLESMSARRASLTLSKLNLKIDVRSVRMNGTPGVVIAQSPAFTTFAASGDVVAVCVRRAAIVPNVVGRTFEAGRSVLADSGFESIKTNSFVDDPSQVGVIIRQQPAAGVAAPIGSVEFERNLARARLADLRNLEKNPQAARLEVEDAMAVTLKKNGIALPTSFYTVASGFRPVLPPKK